MNEENDLEKNTYRGVPIEQIALMYHACVVNGVDFSNKIAVNSYWQGYRDCHKDMEKAYTEAIFDQLKDTFRIRYNPFKEDKDENQSRFH